MDNFQHSQFVSPSGLIEKCERIPKLPFAESNPCSLSTVTSAMGQQPSASGKSRGGKMERLDVGSKQPLSMQNDLTFFVGLDEDCAVGLGFGRIGERACVLVARVGHSLEM